jgi:PST family polysaccharide transporter
LKLFDEQGFFRSRVGEGEVRQLAIRGAGVTVFSGGLGLAIQVVATVLLARLLTPMDFGLVTMVTTFSLLLVNFGLNGFTEAVLQAEEITHRLASNLFWINSVVGLALTIGFAAAGSLMARLYHDPLVARVAIGISPTIFITSLSVLHLALLKRAMRFTATSTNEILSRGISLGISIVLAWMGWGYWALVVGAVAQPLAQTLGAWILCPWFPGFPARVEGTAAMVRFAMNVYGRFTLNYFARNTDNLLVGWRFGSIPLGFYKKAYDLFALSAGQLAAPITNVAVAALSRYNARSIQYKQNLLSALSVTAFIGMGLSAQFALIGHDLIRLLLGRGWEPAGRIFTYFAPGIGAMLVYYVHGWIHLSIGRADRWLRWGIFEIAVTFLFFLIGLPWGPVGIAIAWSASFWTLTIPALWYAGRPIQFEIAPVLRVVWKYIAASLVGGLATAGIDSLFPILLPTPHTVREAAFAIVIKSLIFGVAYLNAVVVLHWSLDPLLRVARLLREMTLGNRIAAPFSEAPRTLEPALSTNSVAKDGVHKPLVSILIPAHNAEEWIADTIRSAIAQTWEPKEIIVVDDGSTDRTLAIARQFESDTIRVLTQENQGAAAARNHAYSVSRGEYIQWLDADDLLSRDKIARQMAVMEECKNNRLLLSSGFGLFKYRSNRAQFRPSPLWCDLSKVEWLIRKMGQNAYMQTATWLVSRELTEAAGSWNTQLIGDDDGEYFCRVLLASDGVRFVPGAKVYYRAPWVGTLSFVGRSDARIVAHWKSMQLHIRYLRSLEDSERVRAACMTYLQSCYIYFYPEKIEIIREAEALAKELGGKLEVPALSWKYSWINRFFGFGSAKHAGYLLPQLRWWVEKTWDKTLFRFRTALISGDLNGEALVRKFGSDEPIVGTTPGEKDQ